MQRVKRLYLTALASGWLIALVVAAQAGPLRRVLGGGS
jgi:hypothetical protein